MLPPSTSAARRLCLAAAIAIPPACSSSTGPDIDDGGSSTGEGTVSSTSAGATSGATTTTTSSGTADGGSTGAQTELTYHADVRALLERHCVACHSPDNIGPFELQTYQQAYDVRELIAAVVSAGTMPPWGMDPACVDVVGDPTLSEDERQTIVGWVDGGAVEGDPADYVAPEPLSRPTLSRVDLTLGLPEPYAPAQSPDDYRCFVLPWPEAERTYVTGFEFAPDNVTMAHHAIAYLVEPADVAGYQDLDAAEEGPGYTCFGGPTGGGPLDFLSSRWLSAWAPGGGDGDFPAGTGVRVEPGSAVILQMHYNTAAADGEPDQSQMRYRLDADVDREALILPWADPGWISGAMNIPAGTDDTVHSFALDPTTVIGLIADFLPSDAPLQLHSSNLHMHKRGSSGASSIARGDGGAECLLSVPNFDFDWQFAYRFQEPKILMPGDQLTLQCQWDNLDNDQDVNWGDGTDDEMCLGVFYVTEPP